MVQVMVQVMVQIIIITINKFLYVDRHERSKVQGIDKILYLDKGCVLHFDFINGNVMWYIPVLEWYYHLLGHRECCT